MAAVDPEDDSISRWVVHHYRYDSQRRQRRHVLVRAFDNRREFELAMSELRSQIAEARRSAESDSREHVTGTVWEPGDRASAAVGHMVRRAMEHGVDPRRILESGTLPSNMAILQFDDHEPR
jgi:hypothetical protein